MRRRNRIDDTRAVKEKWETKPKQSFMVLLNSESFTAQVKQDKGAKWSRINKGKSTFTSCVLCRDLPLFFRKQN